MALPCGFSTALTGSETAEPPTLELENCIDLNLVAINSTHIPDITSNVLTKMSEGNRAEALMAGSNEATASRKVVRVLFNIGTSGWKICLDSFSNFQIATVRLTEIFD